MCPARTRSAWPVNIVTWWKPSQPREKPPYSYATLIAHAILSSKDGRLTLSDIYRWISVYYPFFTLGRRGWQNSIRHNLSLNKKWFVKLDRRPTQANPGKGCYWTL
ncbi:fork head transcription factor, partial [Phycomyces blakesleeanus NRRL 1555(-)]